MISEGVDNLCKTSEGTKFYWFHVSEQNQLNGCKSMV